MRNSLIFILIFIPLLFSQVNNRKTGYPKSDYLLIPNFHSSQVKVNMFSKVLHDALIFTTGDSNKFVSDFIIDFSFVSMTDPAYVVENNVHKNISVDRFRDTNADNIYAEISAAVAINPDQYRFSLKGYTDNGRKELFNYSDTLDWQLIRGTAIARSFVIGADSTALIFQKTFPFGLHGHINIPVYWEESSAPDSILLLLYKDSKNKMISKNMLRFPKMNRFVKIPESIENLPEGKYTIQTLFFKNKKAVRDDTQIFTIRWLNKPWSLSDISLALKPLSAVLENDMESVVYALDRNKEYAFKKYWKAIDPTPKTEYNELMLEFYKRADETQRKFGTDRKYGWETDMGEIYLKYGPPEKVNDKTLNPNGKQFVEWLYPTANLKFTFIPSGNEFELKGIRSLEGQNVEN